ncbi:hypothetical protein IMSAGC013_03240 [Lachnospiraceae bacterium]|nr:hypothetical protein IMSAGC013_03240 [Lachnospiraceae bacterium]
MSVENKNVIEEYEKDKENFKNFTEHKTATFNANSLRRLVLSELSYKGAFKYNRIFGFTRNQIVSMTQYPERYPNHIIRLSRYMYLKSGYYKRLIDYFANSAILNWTIDTEIKQDKMFTTNPKTFRKNYINYTTQVNKFKLDNRVTDIFKRLFIDDACFGFVTENDIDASIFLLEPDFCKIEKLTNGSIYQFSVNRSLIDVNVFKTLPEELQILIEQSKEVSLDNRVMIPYENSFCIKYNDDFTYLYPCFFSLISELLNIDDIKDLVKAKSEADAYKLIYFKIPTNDEDQISMGDELISKFVEMACAILPERFGVIPSPMDLQLIESKSTISDDKNKVEQAVDNYYGEAGVSKALISSASSGSELKLSMKVDSSDIYRIYRQIEAWVDLQMKLRGHIYNDYQFVYRILPTTIFDVDDYVDRRLKLAQTSLPIKEELLSAIGVNTAKMLGNSFTEQIFKEDIFDKWEVLKTSYTTAGDNSEGGAPMKDETEISKTTENTHDNDGNDPDNRV